MRDLLLFFGPSAVFALLLFAAVSLGALRVTPVMEAGIAKHVWSVEEIAALLES